MPHGSNEKLTKTQLLQLFSVHSSIAAKTLTCVVYLSFLFSISAVQAQYSVSGKIVDDHTKMSIAGVSIFFPELNRGVASDSSGSFIIPGIPTGKHLIEISHIGYQTVFYQYNIPLDSPMLVRLASATSEIREVIVTGVSIQPPDETTLNVNQLNALQIQTSGALNLSDALAQMPGISQLTTGPGISKPVIRGLYGNRIQVNVDGLRFDNQQWQDEHGLGLSDIGVERVDIIKGPASVLYGSDAMGGVVNIVDERPALVNTTARNLLVRTYSNTYGISVNYGVKSSTENRWKKFRTGVDSHADYWDGKHNRILNSRFSSFNIKFGRGKNNAHSNHAFNITASHGMFGFVFDSLTRKQMDSRVSRSFDGPYHAVSFIKASNESNYYKNAKHIKFNVAAISNLRLENEGGGGISLSMLLNSANALLQISQGIGTRSQITYGGSVFGQTNTNFGGRIIIPDAVNAEAALFTHYKYLTSHMLFEFGMRYDKKLIETFATRSLNVIGNGSPTEEIVPFTKFYNAFNLSSGARFNPSENLSFIFNVSSGYRPGNLAELSSNGLHEGTMRWEIGLANAKIEQNLNVEGTINYTSNVLQASVSGYSNSFKNFLYLAPTGDEFYGFAVYHFSQSDAKFSGGEAVFDFFLPESPLKLHGSYSLIRAQKSNGDPLPFIPPNKLTSDVTLNFSALKWIVNYPCIKVGLSQFFAQKKPAEFESATAAYRLLHASINANLHAFDFSIRCNNLLSEKYMDHLSRYKYYGFMNMGRSIILALNYQF